MPMPLIMLGDSYDIEAYSRGPLGDAYETESYSRFGDSAPAVTAQQEQIKRQAVADQVKSYAELILTHGPAIINALKGNATAQERATIDSAVVLANSEKTFMDKYGIFIAGGGALLGLVVLASVLKKKSRRR